jgi:hypothetical protein
MLAIEGAGTALARARHAEKRRAVRYASACNVCLPKGAVWRVALYRRTIRTVRRSCQRRPELARAVGLPKSHVSFTPKSGHLYNFSNIALRLKTCAGEFLL